MKRQPFLAAFFALLLHLFGISVSAHILFDPGFDAYTSALSSSIKSLPWTSDNQDLRDQVQNELTNLNSLTSATPQDMNAIGYFVRRTESLVNQDDSGFASGAVDSVNTLLKAYRYSLREAWRTRTVISLADAISGSGESTKIPGSTETAGPTSTGSVTSSATASTDAVTTTTASSEVSTATLSTSTISLSTTSTATGTKTLTPFDPPYTGGQKSEAFTSSVTGFVVIFAVGLAGCLSTLAV